MKYQGFQRLRAPVWQRLRELLHRAQAKSSALSFEELEELAITYRQVLHDYSLASSRFPGTAVTRDLRRLVLEATHFLQRDTGSHLPSLRRFVGRTFPQAISRVRSSIGVAVLLFVALALFGFAATAVHPGMALGFLPPSALQGLEEGKLWTESIFAVTPGSVASTHIATNNLSVALTAWAGGILAGFGSLWIAGLNGLMLGSVLAATAHYSLMPELLEFIAAHGPLEISLILVAAGAGLHMGFSWIRATDRPRSVELREAGKDSLNVLLGCLPWIFILGFVEGFVSPSADFSALTKASLGLLLEAVFLIWAFGGLGSKTTVDLSGEAP